MAKSYQPQSFESKWVDYWQKKKVYQTKSNSKKTKLYALSMFPYPSGAGLHVGHVRIYTGTDVLARYFRMKGYSVLHPMGWDAFGLPAENAAIKAKKNPMDMVPKNIATFKRQMQMLGLSYDWSREFATTDPEYYRWTQWLFIQFFKAGLLYKKDTPVYFCPFCKTGLAEEEVLANGTHERCGKTITRKHLPQWLFQITKYADSLLKSLEGLDWPNGVLEMQRNWIGRDRGLAIDFIIPGLRTKITVWTKFWETVFGTTFLVLAPEHLLIEKIKNQTVMDYVAQALAKTDEQRLKDGDQKTGVFTGLFAVNPVNQAKVPIWVADYVLGNVGTGAVMGVPAHDERDFEFAQKYQLPIIQVVSYADAELDRKVREQKISHEGEGKLINSGKFNGLSAWGNGKTKMAEWMIKEGTAKWQTSYHLRDWIFSRQRYWGEPIPMVYCKRCAERKLSYFDTVNSKKDIEKPGINMYGWFPISEEELPLKLPYLKEYLPTGTGESPLAQAADWVQTKCPNCGEPAARETDTMPNWAGSCWYFLRFATHNNTPGVFQADGTMNSPYLPVDWYLGGAEHAVLHLLYARFWIHVLNDQGLLNFREPFLRLRNVGMVLAEDHRKMSKSLGNVINPDEIVAKFGADSLRIYEMFMAPFAMEIAWSTNSLLGANRFLAKVYQLYHTSARIAKDSQTEDQKLVAKLQYTINKVNNDIANVKFNTAIAALMEFANTWQQSRLSLTNAKKFLQILAPFAPFLAEELWQTVAEETTSVHLSEWPRVEKVKISAALATIPVQINGKLRALLQVDNKTTDSRKSVEALAQKNAKIKKYLAGKKYKTIYVPGKILNFII